ncbi:MAG: sigma factor-like helix-turn-helix DNA-binding protein [Patescibacteria group bacterium]
MKFNYQTICVKPLNELPERTKNIIERRFGLVGVETLEAIGRDYGITRERVRQIESDGLSKMTKKLGKNHEVFKHLKDFLKNFGGLRREDILIKELGGNQFQPQALLLLNLSKELKKHSANNNFYTFWTIDNSYFELAKKNINILTKELKDSKQTMDIKDCAEKLNIKPKVLISYLEISKVIEKGPEGRYGLSDWPEINPRGVKDKAYLVFKRLIKPLHFSEVASLIGEKALVQTVHNELIRDPRFVLVGRGIYALSEWGYQPGTVKDVIFSILKESKTSLSKDEVLGRVLEKRLVKENTILLNLSNKDHFSKDTGGKYQLRDA